MRNVRWRAVLVIAVVLAGVLTPVGSAQAAHSGAGWSAQWHYLDADRISVGMSTSRGRLSGTVSEADGRRSLSLVLTDSTAGAQQCVSLQIAARAGGPATFSTQLCSGSRSIVLSMTGEQHFFLCTNFYSPPGAGIDCNRMVLPVVPAALRGFGTAVVWAYSSTPGQERTFGWRVQLMENEATGTGRVSVDPFGHATWSIQGSLDTRGNASSMCISGDLYEQGSTRNPVVSCDFEVKPLGRLFSASPRFRVAVCRLGLFTPAQCVDGWIA